MTRASPRLGRPLQGDTSGEMKRISFRVDDETEQALLELERRLDSQINGRRSVVLRRLILDAFRNLSD